MGRIGRRRFLAALGSAAVAIPAMRNAASAESVPRVGWLSPGSPKSHGHFLLAFKKGLADHGYDVGTTIAVEERWANGRLNAVPNWLVNSSPWMFGRSSSVALQSQCAFAK